MASEKLIAASTLWVGGGSTASLSDVVTAGGDGAGVTLGSGAFGKVDTYVYNGAEAAVKKLKPGASEESIGTERAGVDILARFTPICCHRCCRDVSRMGFDCPSERAVTGCCWRSTVCRVNLKLAGVGGGFAWVLVSSGFPGVPSWHVLSPSRCPSSAAIALLPASACHRK